MPACCPTAPSPSSAPLGDVYTSGTDASGWDHLNPNLAHIFEFIGITSVRTILIGDSLAVRDGKIHFAEHLAQFAPSVRAAALEEHVS